MNLGWAAVDIEHAVFDACLGRVGFALSRLYYILFLIRWLLFPGGVRGIIDIDCSIAHAYEKNRHAVCMHIAIVCSMMTYVFRTGRRMQQPTGRVMSEFCPPAA